MPFESKHPGLLEEQLRNMDEIAVLMTQETSLAMRLEKTRDRRRELVKRNENIC